MHIDMLPDRLGSADMSSCVVSEAELLGRILYMLCWFACMDVCITRMLCFV